MRELLQAYQESLENDDPDVDVFRVALIERLVMVCDSIGNRARIVRANAGEPEGD